MKVNTENRFSTVQVEYDSEKLEAIRFYLSDRNTTVERELLEAMDAVFKKKIRYNIFRKFKKGTKKGRHVPKTLVK